MQEPKKKDSAGLKEAVIPDNKPAVAELQDVKRVIATFLNTLKNYDLYPAEHAITRKLLDNMKVSIDGFLKQTKRLRVDVGKDALFYRGVVIHQFASEENHIASILFRDGIQWIEFRSGIKIVELSCFLRLMAQNRTMEDTFEKDLVTSLWEEDLPHIGYEAADEFWEEGNKFEFPSLDSAQGGHAPKDTPDDTSDTGQGDGEDMAATEMTATLAELSQEEARKLREMVIAEESFDNTQDIIELLLILLKDQTTESSFSKVLEALQEEFQNLLFQGEFQLIVKLLKKLRKMRHFYENKKSWYIPPLDYFFQTASSPRGLAALDDLSQSLGSMESKQIEMLSHMMLLLNPDAIQSVAPLCADPYPAEIQKRMSSVIKKLAQKDIGPLEKSLSHTDELIVQQLVYILGHLEGEKPQHILIKATHHPSERVRREALKMLLEKKTVNFEKIFHLIEDLSDIIRLPAIKAIGRKRNQQAEDLLQNYLEKELFQITDPRHLLACYQALGQCGSSHSIPFLKRMLLDRALSGLIVKKKSIHQQGAAIALIALDTKEAKDILKNASKSFYPNVRKAYRKAVGVYK